MSPPVGNGRLLLGEDDLGLAAVIVVWFLGNEDGLYIVKLAVVAVALRCRGHRHGDAAMDVALSVAAEQAFDAGARAAYVQGLVDPRNLASKAMNARAGLQFYDLDAAGWYELWARELPPVDDPS